MRVIGGNARGRRLKVPKGQTLRPTAARVKEALFNILPHDLSGAKALDLFAGTGNVTIEALSRGAAAAILVDSSAESGKAIRENVLRLHVSDRTKVWIMQVARELWLLARNSESFVLIFFDTLYVGHMINRSLKINVQKKLLRESGVLIAEHSIREKVEPRYDSLALHDQRRYGSTLLSFFKQEG